MVDVANAESLTEQASGSLGNVTFGRNQHGPWVRTRVTPADPATALQLSVRAHLATCVLAWNATLTQPQRAAWERYALALKLAGLLGRENNVGGIGMYVRSNVPRLQAAEARLPRVDTAPSLLDLGPHTPVTRVVLNVIDDTIHPFFNPADAWAKQIESAMLFWASPGLSPALNFYKGPYRYAGPLLGHPTRLSSPGTIPLPAPAALGQRVFIRARVTRKDGRLSQSFRLPADTVPQVAPLFTDANISPGVPPNFILTVNFDSLIRDQPHLPGSWLWRLNNRLYFPITAVTVAGAIELTAPTGPINAGPDIVRYLTAAPDVYGLLTGIAVANFTAPF